MQKRTTLALVLSFVVLVFWSWLFPPPKAKTRLESQIIVNKEVTSKESLSTSASPSPFQADASIENSNEKFEHLGNDHIALTISNIGAAIDTFEIKQYKHKLPIKNVLAFVGFDRMPFELVEKTDDTISYAFESDDFRIVKKYELSNEYSILSVLEITNKTKMSKQSDVRVKVYSIDGSRVDKSQAIASTLWEYSLFSGGYVHHKKAHPKFGSNFHLKEAKDIKWIGFRDQYYCAIFQPLFKPTTFEVHPANEQLLDITMSSENINFEPNRPLVFETLMHVGPQDVKVLKTYKNDFENIINFAIGNFFDIMAFGLTDVIAKVMLAFFQIIHNVVPNWGLCIILFAITIFFITYPFTRASMMAMQKMQLLQPKIAKLREQHKKNPQKLNEELVLLYKKHKANPFGGCLPVLLQMPIFISLYQLLWRSYIFKGASFLWIKDLSEPDRLFIMPLKMPFVGNEFNILPIVYAILMFIQQRNTAKTAVYADQQQAEMQKMMMYIMPVMLGFLFYKFASGLCLYFIVYFMLSIVAQIKMKKEMPKEEDA